MSAHSQDATVGPGSGIAVAVRSFVTPWLSHRRRIVLWSFVDQVIISGFGFATGIATGRLVGITEFGKFAIAMIFVTLASSISGAIFATPMMTLAGHRRRSRGYFAVVVAAGSVGAAAFGLIAAALFATFYLFRGESLSPGLAAATGMLVAVQCVQLTLRRVLFASRKGRLAATFDLFRYVLFVAFIGGALLTGGSKIDTEVVLWSLALSGAIAGAASASMTGILGAHLRLRMLLATAHQHWQIARWFVAVSLVGFGQDQLLWILASPVLGDAAIGGLKATLYLFGPILVLMGAMENILPVRAAETLAAHGLVGLKKFLVRFAVPLGAANGTLILIAVLPGAAWLAWLFGPAYVDYVPVLQIMGVATAFSFVRDYLIQYFRAIRRTNTIFYSFLSGFIVAVVLIYPLVKWFGVEGLAIDTAISQFASMLYLIVATGRHYLGHRRSASIRRVVEV